MSETTREPDARRLATDARDRVRFEEEALALSDQVYRVARHLVRDPDEAAELMQETYARAFRSRRSFTPGTNLRAWLLRILTNLNIDRGRRKQRAPDEQPAQRHAPRPGRPAARGRRLLPLQPARAELARRQPRRGARRRAAVAGR